MFGIHHYASFVAAILVFQLVPGPGTLAILRSTARGGFRAGMGAVLGTLSGDFLFMLAAVLGLAAVLAANPVAFAAMRWLGIAYLIGIGVSLLRAKAAGEKETASSPVGASLHFRRGFAVALTNPKAIMFFMAFFPLFLRSDARAVTLGIMMVHVTLLSLLYQTLLVLIGNAAAKRLSRIRAVRLLATRLAGLALIGFGIRLAIDGR